MNDRISIITPDHIELDLELAGIGSRLLALLADALVIFAMMVALLLMVVAAGVAGFATARSASAGSWALALAFLLYFVLMWGYFLIFEALRNGQTPGKRWTGIRVVRDDGLSVGWRESALRNLVRAADMLPPPACLVGAFMIMFSKNGKRLGDLLAGTIVVTHDAQLTSTLADSLVVMDAGQVIAAGDFDEVKRSRNPRVRAILSEVLKDIASYDTDLLQLLDGDPGAP